MRIALIPCLILLSTAAAAPREAGGDLASLVAAERAFARTSVEKDTREAFLAFLAQDAILFRPGPVPGRPWIEERPAPPWVLSWQPVAAEVSRGGDLGYTTGPWEIGGDPSRPPAHGQYFSIWQRQADGAWKVLLDVGTVGPPPDAPAEPWQGGESPAHWTPASGEEVDPAAAEEILLARDRELARAVTAEGPLSAYLAHLTADARLLRDGRPPALGRQGIREVMAEAGSLSWEPQAAGVAASADLGYTWGAYQQPAGGPEEEGDKGHYVRLWRREPDGVWRVAVDLLTPLPPPPPPPED